MVSIALYIADLDVLVNDLVKSFQVGQVGG